MPVIHPSTYRPPRLLRNGHLQTFAPQYFRKVNSVVAYTRARIDTPDGDFIDCDWSRVKSRHLAFLLHGDIPTARTCEAWRARSTAAGGMRRSRSSGRND
jgi:predicted alpha/beta-fold hydrolase